MFDYIRLFGETLLFVSALVTVISVPVNFCNLVTYLGAFYILSSDIMQLYGSKKSQNTE